VSTVARLQWISEFAQTFHLECHEAIGSSIQAVRASCGAGLTIWRWLSTSHPPRAPQRADGNSSYPRRTMCRVSWLREKLHYPSHENLDTPQQYNPCMHCAKLERARRSYDCAYAASEPSNIIFVSSQLSRPSVTSESAVEPVSIAFTPGMEIKNPEPERGAAYPIVLGSTLQDDKSDSASEFMLVQYNFQPSIISRAAKGCLSLEHHRTAGKGDASNAKVRLLRNCLCML
jgi:hypothetical protein